MFKSLILLLLLCSACHYPSSLVMEGSGGRNAYNVEIQKTHAEEMLLNIIRLRYYDHPNFLEISSITTTFTFKNLASAGISIPGFNQQNPMILGGEMTWQNQPTIQYTPLEGQEFANQLMQPVELSSLQLIIYSGWDIDRVFRLAVKSFKDYYNLTRGAGPIPFEKARYKTFHQIVSLLRSLQLKSILEVGITSVNNNKTSLQFAFPKDDEDSIKLAELLNLKKPDNGNYIFEATEGFDTKGKIGVMANSILSCMYYLAQSVEIPQKDLDANRAEKIPTPTDTDLANIPHLIKICSSPNKPKNAYVSIKYRDSWFYIKDDELSSKRTFMLLLELYNLQSGRTKEKGPLLTLPIGVG